MHLNIDICINIELLLDYYHLPRDPNHSFVINILDISRDAVPKTNLRWLYTISSVFAGSDIYFFLDILILSTREKYLGLNIVSSSSVLVLCLRYRYNW